MKIIVLGAGLVGGPMAADLAAEAGFEVTAADIDGEALARWGQRAGIATIQSDLSDPATLRRLVSGFDLVLNAMPGRFGFQTLRACLEAGKSVVDISFFAEDPFELDALARSIGATAIVDCGVAPGMSHILAAYAAAGLDEARSLTIYVGGLPEVRTWPYDYKAGFSPQDVIEEYTRPARYVENGSPVVRPALSDPERIDFPRLGTLEAFNTDGLRTLLRTGLCPDMREKTLRYPGHIEKIAVLRETGFFDRDEIEVAGVRVRPLDVTAKLLLPKWKLGPEEHDLTVMRIAVSGSRGGKRARIVFDLLDRYDPATGVHSMARTTGYTATLAVRLLAQGRLARKGIVAPEFIGREPACVEFLLEGLKARGVVYTRRVEPPAK